MEDWKIQVAILWLIDVGCAVISALGELVMPNGIQKLLSTGEFLGSKVTPELLLFYAILLVVPFVMAFLSVTLKNPINRWANIIMAIVWLGIGFIDWLWLNSAAVILLWFTEVVAKVLIIWLAWKSKQKVLS